jgi:hypothetical protein
VAAPTTTCGSTTLAGEPIAGRYALLITNQDYPRSVGALAKTHRDGEIVCEALVALGFEVRHARDVNLQGFQDEVLAHIRRLHAALARGLPAVGFFYFAGHGAAAEKDGDNYLIPTQAPVRAARELSVLAYPLGRLVAAISDTRAKANFIVIDACRDVAFPAPTRGTRGLSPEREEGGVFIAFSTAPGRVALDEHHYSTALAEELQVPDRPAYMAFRSVRRRVLAATSNQQFPWMRDGLVDPFFFKIGGATGGGENTGKPNGPQLPAISQGRAIFRDNGCAVCPDMISLVPKSTEPDGGGLEPFAISREEVTFAEWAACVNDGACGAMPDDAGWGRGGRPVINVSWHDAQRYARWLSEKSGRRYRLPREAEWEYAAQAETGLAYGVTGDASLLCRYANGGDFNYIGGLACDDGRARGTMEVGRYEANGVGLHDMAGNVAEWVDGCYVSGRVTSSPDDRCDRVIKGGSWKSGAFAMRPTSRQRAPAFYKSYTIGFRVVRELLE